MFAVADDIDAEAVEQFGDFRIGFRVEAARVVEHFGLGRGDFGSHRAGGHDTRHLAVDNVGFFRFEHFDVGRHAFEVA